MRIAATITKDGNITKLPDGPFIIIFDTNKKDAEKYDNPGFQLKEGRRSAVVDLFIGKNVNTVITVPEAFCDMSYSKAKKNGINFIRLENSLPYENVIENLSTYLNQVTEKLPDSELFKRK